MQVQEWLIERQQRRLPSGRNLHRQDQGIRKDLHPQRKLHRCQVKEETIRNNNHMMSKLSSPIGWMNLALWHNDVLVKRSLHQKSCVAKLNCRKNSSFYNTRSNAHRIQYQASLWTEH